MYKGWAQQKRLSLKMESLFIVRRKGMSKPPVKLGVDKSYLIEKERTS